MAIEIKHIDVKNEFQEEEDMIIDLTTRSAAFVDEIRASSFVQVESRMEMRPDLFALEHIGTSDFTKLLKFNNISNPFTLDTMDIMFIPVRDNGQLSLSPSTPVDDTESEDVRLSYVDPSKVAMPDPKIATLGSRYDAAATTPEPRKINLPPNFNEFNEDEVEIKNNKIRFAPGVSRNAAECSTEPISKADLISRVIKNKIGG